jgi:hypothetical protein
MSPEERKRAHNSARASTESNRERVLILKGEGISSAVAREMRSSAENL